MCTGRQVKQMIELKGKYNSAKVFTDNCDAATLAQIANLLNQPCVEGSQIRIMPDCHAGAGCVIGTTMTVTDKVIPNLVGVDIGCGMLATRIKEKRVDLPKFDSVSQAEIPAGMRVRKSPHSLSETMSPDELTCYRRTGCRVSPEVFALSLGTLGGGNHFWELDRDEAGDIWLVVHTGSRRSGKDVAEYYQRQAYERLAAQKSAGIAVPYEMAWCEGELLEDYLHDMGVMQRYAALNRRIITELILKKCKLHALEQFETVHNYIDLARRILRKGAVSAAAGERLLIPINMRDGALICVGKGDPDWNESAPHGAGRLMSRAEARESISVKEYKAAMSGIYTTCVGRGTLDESPFAYKPMDEIVANIAPAVEIVGRLKPIYNFKAGEEE